MLDSRIFVLLQISQTLTKFQRNQRTELTSRGKCRVFFFSQIPLSLCLWPPGDSATVCRNEMNDIWFGFGFLIYRTNIINGDNVIFRVFARTCPQTRDGSSWLDSDCNSFLLY